MRSILLLATLVFACGGEQSKPNESAPATTPATTPVTTTPTEPAAPTIDAGATAPVTEAPDDADCVKECVASRQMQATSVEQIEADCQKRCAGEDQPLDAE